MYLLALLSMWYFSFKENNNSLFLFEVIIDRNFRFYFSVHTPMHVWSDIQGFGGPWEAGTLYALCPKFLM